MALISESAPMEVLRWQYRSIATGRSVVRTGTCEKARFGSGCVVRQGETRGKNKVRGWGKYHDVVDRSRANRARVQR